MQNLAVSLLLVLGCLSASRMLQAQAAIALSPDRLIFATQPGSDPAPLTMRILNSGSGTLSWSATASTSTGGNWLFISPTSGTAPTDVTVSVKMAALNLAAGTYQGRVEFGSLPNTPATNSPQMLNVSVSVGQPIVPNNSAVNGASFSNEALLSPGAIASVFGTNLSTGTAGAGQIPLPTVLANSQVKFDSVAVPLFYVSPGQINFQVPMDVGTDPMFQVQSGAFLSNALVTGTIKIAPQAPGIFTIPPGGTGQGAVLNADNTLNSPSNPAAQGSIIQIFATGLGQTTPPLKTGEAGTSANQVGSVQVFIGGATAIPFYAGAAPGFIGLYQVNVRLPAIPVSTTTELYLGINQRFSNKVTIAIR